MKTIARGLALLAGIVLLGQGSSALTPQFAEYSVKVDGAGEVVVQARGGVWRKADVPVPQTVQLMTSTESVVLQLSFLARPEGLEEKDLPKRVEDATRQFFASATEEKLEVKPISGKSGQGACVTMTDKRLVGVEVPKKGEYRSMTSGMLLLPKHLVVFTILCNEKGAEYQEALGIATSGLIVR